ncbi:kinase-like domain-containing protein [Pisolithus microcarpus]|nr:kinase-like domain-containing protein [Pisolithus microcarpus]
MHAINEICIWTQVEHENIMPLLGITAKFDQTASMMTEWMARGNAHNYVQDVVVDPRPLVCQLVQLLDVAWGLSYLHNSDIVHGDIKGLNVLISAAGRALVTDFGSSYKSSSLPSMDIDPPRGGSLQWLAPKSLDTCALSQQADVWAYRMTALVRPIHGMAMRSFHTHMYCILFYAELFEDIHIMKHSRN